MSADQSEEVEEVEDVEEAESADKSGRVPWLPLVVVLLVVPIITIAGMEFVVIPKLKSALAVSSGAEPAAKAEKSAKADSDGGGGHGGGGHGGGKEAPSSPATSYKFEEMVTNVAGTMGTRFIKTSFEVSGSSSDLRTKLRAREAQVQDAIMTVLAGRTIKELEAVGGRNALRIDLIEAINSALGQGMVDELYFLELIIQ
ncbi:MAG: flagellar basal body-associated protein FliL [Opitutales bacterium]